MYGKTYSVAESASVVPAPYTKHIIIKCKIFQTQVKLINNLLRRDSNIRASCWMALNNLRDVIHNTLETCRVKSYVCTKLNIHVKDNGNEIFRDGSTVWGPLAGTESERKARSLHINSDVITVIFLHVFVYIFFVYEQYLVVIFCRDYGRVCCVCQFLCRGWFQNFVSESKMICFVFALW